MSNLVTFDDLDAQGTVESQKPFFAIDLNNDDEVHTWLKANLAALQQNSWMRLEKVKNNYLRYKGIQYIGQVYQPRDVPETRKRYMPQMVIPLIRDAVDEKVARLMEAKPTVTVIPRDDEERDKVDAKIAKRFLSHIEYQEKMQKVYRAWLKNAEIGGESFLLPRWNPDKGDILKETQALEMVDGNEQTKRRAIHQGDVECKVFTPHYAFYEEHPSKDWKDVNYIFLIEFEYTEGLKQDYPKKAGDIRAEPTGTTGGVYFDYESMEEKPLQGFTQKVTFYHRATKYLPEGYEAVFTNGVLLKRGPLPKEYEGQLPPERMVMAENEEELHGVSPIEAVRGMAAQVSNYENLIIKQLMLTAHPKWFVEAGAVDDQQLNNDVGIVKVKTGAKPPVLAQANPVSPQIMEHSKQLQEKFYSFAKSNSVVRGEPPAGVTAFVALQYVSEAESRRLSTEVSYFSEGVVGVNQKILNICAERYRPQDNRTMQIVGKDNRFNLLKYDPSTLKKKFTVLVQNSTGLPDSKSAKIQAVLETEERFPNMLPREQVTEMLGFAQSAEKFYDIAGMAARAAEEENEFIMDGNGMMEPAEHEDHITHWKVHFSAMQDSGFKTKVGPQVVQMMYGHMAATEMFMMDMMGKSPSFAQRVQLECPQFPCIMTPPPPPPMPPIGPDGMPLPPEAMMDPNAGAPMPPPAMPPAPGVDPMMAGLPSPDQTAPAFPPGPQQPMN